AAYVQALRDLAHIHAICEEYRAAATLDREHDQADRREGRRIVCPLLVLWSAHGALETWYAEAAGPLALWHAWSGDRKIKRPFPPTGSAHPMPPCCHPAR